MDAVSIAVFDNSETCELSSVWDVVIYQPIYSFSLEAVANLLYITTQNQ